MSRLDPMQLSASAAAECIREGSVTSRELTDACLRQIEAREAEVGAFAYVDAAYARQQASQADDALRAGRGMGPLHGVPVAVKDIIDTADMPTENGFPAAFAGRRPDKDAFVVAQLRAAGAVILGKTVSSPLANPGPIKTRNPHDTSRTPGTSSSGSAAAVAAGMAPLAVGTQTAGSVIRPASFCGTYGFKPTFGLLSREGVLLQSETLDTLGVFARTVEDLALLTDAMAVYDPRDPASLKGSRGSLVRMASQPVPVPPLFAFVKSPFWERSDPAVHEAWGELTGALGQQSREVELVSLEDLYARMADVMAKENAVNYATLYARHRDALSPLARANIERGQQVRDADYAAALAARDKAYEMIEDIFVSHGYIMTLASDGVAPQMDAPFTPNYNGVWTFLGVPAVTLPLLSIDGMPLGVQIVGARGDDGRVLRAAKWLADFVAQLED